VLFERFQSLDTPEEKELEHFNVSARQWIAGLEHQHSMQITNGVTH
jgi:hypothetical protein